MNGFRRFYNTARIIFYALFPPSKKVEGQIPAPPSVSGPENYIPVIPADVPYYLADFSRALSNNRISLFFPESFAIAGFFLLLRLKRQGFSSTRALAISGGVAIEGNR